MVGLLSAHVSPICSSAALKRDSRLNRSFPWKQREDQKWLALAERALVLVQGRLSLTQGSQRPRQRIAGNVPIPGYRFEFRELTSRRLLFACHREAPRHESCHEAASSLYLLRALEERQGVYVPSFGNEGNAEIPQDHR